MGKQILTTEDYLSLKQSVNGWTAKRLRGYGISWPPKSGWRKRLLREYENAPQVKQQSKKQNLPNIRKTNARTASPSWKLRVVQTEYIFEGPPVSNNKQRIRKSLQDRNELLEFINQSLKNFVENRKM